MAKDRIVPLLSRERMVRPQVALLVFLSFMCITCSQAQVDHSNSDAVVDATATMVISGAALGVAAAFPPAAPFVAFGALAVGIVMKLKQTFAANDAKEEAKKREEQRQKIMADNLRNLTHSLKNMNATLYNHTEMLENVQDSLTHMNGTLYKHEEMLENLEKSMVSMGKKMDDQFKKLELNLEFQITTHNQRSGVLTDMESLWDMMKLAIKHKSKSSIDKFLSAYNSKTPVKMLIDIANSFTLRTNPIISAMEMNALNSRTLLNNCLKLFAHAVSKTITMEGFHYGVSELSEQEDAAVFMNYTKEAIELAMNKIIESFHDYKMETNLYWPNPIMGLVKNSLGDPNLTIAADIITDKLNNIYTTDTFSVTVFKRSSIDQTPLPLIRKNNREYNATIQDSKKFMLTHYDETSHNFVVILRSENSATISMEQHTRVRTSFHTFFHHLAWMRKMVPQFHIGTGNEDGYEEFVELLMNFDVWSLKDTYDHHTVAPIVYAPRLPLLNGFIAKNITPVVRYTKNQSSILPDNDISLIDVYCGLNWA